MYSINLIFLKYLIVYLVGVKRGGVGEREWGWKNYFMKLCRGEDLYSSLLARGRIPNEFLSTFNFVRNEYLL